MSPKYHHIHCIDVIFIPQVDAALLSDVGNPQLIKLHGDLQEVVDLTVSLLEAQKTKSGNGGDSIVKPQGKRHMNPNAPIYSSKQQKPIAWKVGDKCSAVYEQTKMLVLYKYIVYIHHIYIYI